jgi:hypothetical protein
MIEVRGRKSEVREWRMEDGEWKMEDGGKNFLFDCVFNKTYNSAF